MYALYFAMLTLEAYQSTPFHLRVNQLNEKFENCLSKNQIKQIHQMKKVLQFETYLEEEEIKSRFSIDELVRRSLEIYQAEKSIDFEVEILEQAKDLFYKEYYPPMKIENGHKTMIKGFYNPGEEEFIADYFMRFGNHVISVKPESLKQIIQDRAESLLNHYQKL